MKASEILAKYAAGERNFQRLNLRGQSFKGKDLAGAERSQFIYAQNCSHEGGVKKLANLQKKLRNFGIMSNQF
jgi:hypothetical protein